MNFIVLIGSITAFVCAFIPLFGIPFTAIFSIIAIVYYVLNRKKEKKKDKKDSHIVSLILAVLAIIVSVVINLMSTSFIKSVLNIQDSSTSSDYYQDKFETYAEYNINDEDINIGDEFKLVINEIKSDDDYYYLNVTIECIKDSSYFSIYNFGVYDSLNDEFNYTSTSAVDNSYISGVLNNEDEKDVVLKITKETYEKDAIYLVYLDDESGIKIAL